MIGLLVPEDVIEIIDYNEEMVLWDSNLFRAGIISDFFKGKNLNIFILIKFYFLTHYRNIKTKQYYKRLPRDPDYWIFIEKDEYHYYSNEKYTTWLDEHNIKYHKIWGHSVDPDRNFFLIFEKKKDAVFFKMVWG